MLRSLVDFLLGRKGAPTPQPEAPYKVESPAQPDAPKCGCGRSQSGLCVGLHKLTPEEWAVHESNPNATKPVADAPKPAKKRTVKKREEGGTAKVARIKAKAPAKPKAVPKPRTPK